MTNKKTVSKRIFTMLIALCVMMIANISVSAYSDTYTTPASTSAIGISPWDNYSLGSSGAYPGVNLAGYGFPASAVVSGNNCVAVTGTLSNPSASTVYLQIRPAGATNSWTTSKNSTNSTSISNFTFEFNLSGTYSVGQRWELRLYRPSSNNNGLSFYSYSWKFYYQY